MITMYIKKRPPKRVEQIAVESHWDFEYVKKMAYVQYDGGGGGVDCNRICLISAHECAF